MNHAFDLLLSVTIGFSQTLYRDIHNHHHRGNSDLPNADGKTIDPLSIYLRGNNGQPENPWAYTFLSFFATTRNRFTRKCSASGPTMHAG